MSASEKSIFLIPGMQLIISILMENTPGTRGIGFFAWPEQTIIFGGKQYNLVNGFGVGDEIVGTLTDHNEGMSVVYTHKRPEKNFINFFSLTGEIGVVSIVSVPVHDHSSIVQGGPAYATYFNDDEVVTGV